MALGLLAGTVGLALGTLGSPGRYALCAVLILYSLGELGGRQVPFPMSSWQVPERFRRTPYVRTMSFLWGIGLGFGWATVGSVALLVATIGMLGVSPAVALAAGMVFGLSRGLTILLGCGTDDQSQVQARFDAIRDHQSALRFGSGLIGLVLVGLIVSTTI